MNETTNFMTITIKLSAEDIQAICEINKLIKNTDKENIDSMTLNLKQKHVVESTFSKIASSARRKAEKLEALSSEFKNSIEFGNID